MARVLPNRIALVAAMAAIVALCTLMATGIANAAEQSDDGSAPVKVTAPKTPSFKVPEKGSTKMMVSLKVKGGADGFQVIWREGKNPWNVRNTKKTLISIPKLEVNHTYKIKVRAYNLKPNGKKAYSPYCEQKVVFNGVKPLESSEIKTMWYKPFIHGTKKAGQQRYIMLHDTESYAGPTNIVNGWKSDNGGTVAAHFVVGRDGKVVQTAKMSRILHHAGFGGPGNYDKKFGVGKNNGKGKGDDLKGQVWWSGYSSYGMNSYSIGIEMCHVGGQNYTAKQLKAVDRLIATIDQAYGGYGGKIIDHKTWRPSNSDCDSKFQKYLKNYQKYRKHTA
ncbi:MAG: N-acetylmuramoyl-L-alanine amidase [Coriobacteriaceae bacterium]|nr:N-acetylmuramoyl-L-alanine amidase [Coriobacteriaceae bacterium]